MVGINGGFKISVHAKFAANASEESSKNIDGNLRPTFDAMVIEKNYGTPSFVYQHKNWRYSIWTSHIHLRLLWSFDPNT